MAKREDISSASACVRSQREQTEWKVPRSAKRPGPHSSSTRSFISLAALLVKVTARIWLRQASFWARM